MKAQFDGKALVLTLAWSKSTTKGDPEKGREPQEVILSEMLGHPEQNQGKRTGVPRYTPAYVPLGDGLTLMIPGGHFRILKTDPDGVTRSGNYSLTLDEALKDF